MCISRVMDISITWVISDMATQNKAKLSAKNRELGRAHKARAAALKRAHVRGTPCWWCGEPMLDVEGLDADHSLARSVHQGSIADRLMHAPCNRARGNGDHDDERPALKKVEQYGGLVENMFDWPVLPTMVR